MDWLLFASIILLFATSSQSQNCPRGTGCGPCQIYPTGDYEIDCGISPNGRSSFTVKYKPGEYVHITCHDGSNWSDFHLESKQPGQIKTVYFRMCELPQGNHLSAIVNKLLGDDLDGLDFRSFDNITSSLSRESLKGFEKIKKLTLSSNSLTSISEDLMRDLTNLTLLNLRENNISELPAHFLNLPNLRSLELGSNKLKVIEAGVFNDVQNLRLLNIWSNRLIEIKPHAFDQMTLLTSLDLHTNYLSNLPSQLFSKLTKLRVINLTQNNFTADAFPADLLKGLNNLETVMIMNNRQNMTTLPSGFFSNLQNLTVVKMRRSGLIYLPENLFWGSTKLRNLSMERNFIQSIPQELFRDCQNLGTLDLSFNELSHLPNHIFSSLIKLEALDLSKNHIKSITENMLNGLSSLRVINMERNGLTSIDHHAFQTLQQLRILHFEHNNLTLKRYSSLYFDYFGTYSPFHHCLRTMEELHFDNNNISEIFTDWMHASHLKLLNLAHNTLQSMHPTDLQFLSQNEVHVDLTYNEIKWISFAGANRLAQSQHRPREITVDVQNNPLSCDCYLYDLLRFREHKFDPNVDNLFKLKLGKSKCSEPEPLKGVSISEFNSDTLTCDFIKSQTTNATCPESCNCYKRPSNRAYIIDCSNRGLTSTPAPNLIHAFNGRVEMNLSGNNLKSLPSLNRPGYNRVARLDLSNNNISIIDHDFVKSENLEYLYLSNNNLKHIDSKVLDYWMDNSTTLKDLNLEHNPWACDCESRDFVNFIQKMRIKIPDLQKVTCDKTNEFIFEITPDELCPIADIGLIVGLSMGVALLGIIIGGFAALYYRYQHEIKVYLYAHQWCLWTFVTEDELDKGKTYDAFISFSQKDEDFITKELVPNLENGSRPFKLCVHYRDWMAGEWIPNQIARSIEQSRRTIVVLSPNFLESVWGKLEFRAAHSQALREGRARVIVILFGDIGSTEDLDPELKAYLNMNTYVRWGDPWFWEKLRYALPRVTDFTKKPKNISVFETHHPTITINTDKSELIAANESSTPSPLTSTPPADTIRTFIRMENEIKKKTENI